MATLNLAAVIEQHARRRPDRVALVFGETRITFGELDAWANRIAGGLAASGIKRGAHVALPLDDEEIEAMRVDLVFAHVEQVAPVVVDDRLSTGFRRVAAQGLPEA